MVVSSSGIVIGMKLIVITFTLSIVLELLLYTVVPLWKVRKAVAVSYLLLAAFSAGAIFAWVPHLITGLAMAVALYRIINGLRIVQGRMHDTYLYNATRRTGLLLIIWQLALLGLLWAWGALAISNAAALTVFTSLQAAVAAILLYSTWRSIRKTRPVVATERIPDLELPSITIAIPARNETEDLQRCLETIIASDYPKFEVLVLDDCSQNKRTPDIIRSFAHDGVRFIPGEEPKESWLAKNQAYDRLAQEANGEYVLFCGVDVRFNANTIRTLVTNMLIKDKKMASILPLRINDAVSDMAVIQAMRYWWELAPPRRLVNRPPVLSSLWVIQKKALKAAGGFAAVARSIVPEAYFARELVKTDDYTFMRSDYNLGAQSIKTAREQRDTAIRTRYPQLHRRPEHVWLATLAEAGLLLAPFVIAVLGFIITLPVLAHVLAVAASVLLAVAYAMTAVLTRVNTLAFALVAFPVVVLIDLYIAQRSMWLYEFAEVIWKGRNICIPVMHTYSQLPALPPSSTDKKDA